MLITLVTHYPRLPSKFQMADTYANIFNNVFGSGISGAC